MESTEKVSSIIKVTRPIFARHPEVKLAYLFGSQAVGDAGSLSDYDFAVYFDESLSNQKMFDLNVRLSTELSKVLGANDVDLMTLNTAEMPELKFAVISEGQLIFERESYRLLVEPRLMNEYYDFRYDLIKYGLTKVAV